MKFIHAQSGKEVYLNDKLAQWLDLFKKRNNKGWDTTIIIAGDCGAGKSNLAFSICAYLDPNFNIDHVVFDAEELIKAATTFNNLSAIQPDESYGDFNTQQSRDTEYLRTKELMQYIRKKSHFFVFCIPSFWDMEQSLAVSRSDALFVVYGSPEGDRGDFAAFDRKAKRELYYKGKKNRDEFCITPNFRGTFPKNDIIPDNLYQNKKDEFILSRMNARGHADKLPLIERGRIYCELRDKFGLTMDQIAEVFKLSRKTLDNNVSDFYIMRRKAGDPYIKPTKQNKTDKKQVVGGDVS